MLVGTRSYELEDAEIAYNAAYGGDDLFGLGEFGGFDLSLDGLEALDLDIDASDCEGLDEDFDEDALKDCLKQVEEAAKALEIAALMEDAWADFKEEADE